MTWGFRSGVAAVFIAAVLVACGSEDAFVGGGGGGGGGGVGPPPVAETLLLLADPPVLPSHAIDDAEGVTIIAIARNEDNLVVPGVVLSFSADSGALNVADPVTDDSGRATAILTTGGDPRNRTVTVNVEAGGAERSITVVIGGTTLQVDGPQSIESGESEEYSILLRDSAGQGLRDVTITATSANGNLITPATAVTDTSGEAVFEVSGTAGGTDTLTFEGLGVTTEREVVVSPFGFVFIEPAEGTEVELGDTVDIEVELRLDGTPVNGETVQFSTTRGTLSAFSQVTAGGGRAAVTLTSAGANGAGPVLVTALGPGNVSRKLAFEFVATTPATITTQVDPATVAPQASAAVIAVVRDAQSNPVKNQVVRFTLTDVSGGSLASSTAVTDTQGVARTTYTASSAASAQDGVRIVAEVGDPAVATDDATITVAAPTLFIVLGSDNQIEKNDAEVTYDKIYNALITDAAGNPPPPGTQFRLSLRSLEYQKGRMAVAPGVGWLPGYQIDDTDAFFGTAGPYFGNPAFGCRSEDPQGTGNINLADDYNNNGQIDPANVAIVPSTAEISEEGVAAFTVRWPQNYALWALVRLTATAVVSGTESVRRLDFVLPIAADDIEENSTPPNIVSPWGIEDDCTDPT